MLDHAPSCLLCGATSSYALTAFDRNREITDERFIYNRCTACGTVFLIDVPDDLAPYYTAGYHCFGPDGEPAWTRDSTFREIEAFRTKLLARHVEPGVLIDIGAGPGSFVAASKQAGYEVTAIEMDARCCDYIETSLGARAICSDQPVEVLATLGPARVISLWHVLEHLRDPAEMMRTAATRLELGGVLALGVPNARSLQFSLLGSRWAHLDAPRHLSLSPAEALIGHGRGLGLRPLAAITDDPFGRLCNFHGWVNALRPRPAHGDAGPVVARCAQALAGALGPVERRGRRGAALTLLFLKED